MHHIMKKVATRTLKIAIESHSVSAENIEELNRWENEGGQPRRTAPDLLESLIPVKKGEIFEVKGGDFHTLDGEIYYEAEIEILSLP